MKPAVIYEHRYDEGEEASRLTVLRDAMSMLPDWLFETAPEKPNSFISRDVTKVKRGFKVELRILVDE
jgi:hypothetical protein